MSDHNSPTKLVCRLLQDHSSVYTPANRLPSGAAINCCPNATRVLEEWGFDFEAAQAVRVKKVSVVTQGIKSSFRQQSDFSGHGYKCENYGNQHRRSLQHERNIRRRLVLAASC